MLPSLRALPPKSPLLLLNGHDAPWAMLATPAPMTSYTFGKQMSPFGGEHDNGCTLPRWLVL